MEMLEIIHNNCKKEQLKRQRIEQQKQYNKEQEFGKKMCKYVFIACSTCLVIELAIVLIERFWR